MVGMFVLAVSSISLSTSCMPSLPAGEELASYVSV